MANHPALPLQKAIFDALINHPAVAEMVGNRVYDHVPDGAKFPYIVIGDDSFARDQWLHECFVTVLGMTEQVGLTGAKRLAGLIQNALDVELQVEGYLTQEWSFEELDFLVEENDQTQVAECQFRYLLDPDTE